MKQFGELVQGNVIPVCVYLRNRIAIVIDIENVDTVTSEQICEKITNCEELGLNQQLCSNVFSLWMISPLLELQLKPTDKPYNLRKSWRYFLEQYSHTSYNKQIRDEPRLVFQRNVFFSPYLEEKIKSAFFEGQIEQPVTGLISLMTHQDQPVLVGINSKGLYIIDDIKCVLLLGLKFEEFSWEYARPSKEDDLNCLPCIFIQFTIIENGTSVSKILQIFSRQASLMDALITTFNEQFKLKIPDEVNKPLEQLHMEKDSHSSFIMYPSNLPWLNNKLNKLTLATFDEEGRCIGQMGSWTLSY
ncbi:FERM domain-containing protein 8 isoform X2 [Diorhabda carinulata]|uniref:FERM domain-containing protein 8 isoform X2 n=1 Tax=Diorhabda carinulata TaxID=1163345 RepID=UPI0025A0DB86|nr:FERM domain-containing protein 8 isoform X2 [Diorhabda carinulata]